MYQQIKSEAQKEFKEKTASQEKEFQAEQEKFKEEKKQLADEKVSLQQEVDAKVKEQLKTEAMEIEKKLKETLGDETSEQIKSLQDELDAKSEKLKEHNKLKSDLEKTKREKNELRDEIEAESEKKLNEKLREEKEKFQRQTDEKNQLKMSEKDKMIEDLSKQLADSQRKIAQGLTQRQGEVQELAIEDYLKEQFPFDTIEEIKKGARGADCIQSINTQSHQNCGTIYYESKRTKDFQPGWVEKFKNDIREKGSDLGVLVTEALPKDMERLGLRDGVWICTFEEFKGLCFALRDSVIKIHFAMLSQENKSGKMELLYDFLTSNEFKLQMEGIVEGFAQMEVDLMSEKRAMEGAWKKREKQIQKVIVNTTRMYGSIKGIAGNAISSIKQLELPEP